MWFLCLFADQQKGYQISPDHEIPFWRDLRQLLLEWPDNLWLFDVYIERYRCFFWGDEIIPSCMDYVNFKSHRKDSDMNQLTECFPNTFWIRSDTLEVPRDGSLSFRIRKITSSKPPLDLYSSLLSLALILEDPQKIWSKIEGFAPSKTYFWVDVYYIYFWSLIFL